MIRPWALCAPILVLLAALPLLRPLRHPDPQAISDDELSRLATVQAIVEHRTLAIEQSDFVATRLSQWRGRHLYADQPPMLSALLSGPYWVMHRWGISFANDPWWAAYLLTLIGVTLPVAGAAGLVYRMGRLFELARPWRVGLALAVVGGGGLLAYSTTLNAHAPAATLVLASAACFVHVALTNKRLHSSIWLMLAGAAAALAAVVDPTALVFPLALPLVILSLRWPAGHRLAGMAVYFAGMALPLAVHARLISHAGLARDVHWTRGVFAYLLPPASSTAAAQWSGGILSLDDDVQRSVLQSVALWCGRAVSAFAGPHGLLTHFPIALLGVVGVTMVMHRHWPTSTKTLASVTLGGAVAVLLLYGVRRIDHADAMFASRWCIVFLPLLVFWSGAWLRRPHGRPAWIAASALLAFSAAASVVGATGAMPRDGFSSNGVERYTVAEAIRRLAQEETSADPASGAVAQRRTPGGEMNANHGLETTNLPTLAAP